MHKWIEINVDMQFSY